MVSVVRKAWWGRARDRGSGFAVGKDPLEIRKLNFYDAMGTEGGTRNVTPYHQKVEDCIIQRIVSELEESADYAKRREAIREFNAKSRYVKRGMSLTPVKFGISFTKTESIRLARWCMSIMTARCI